MICSSGIGFDPVANGRRLTFGFDGIWQGTAVLYDHQSQSRWMHITGECFDGPLAGTMLRRLPTGRHTTWADWRAQHPGTDVLAPQQIDATRGGGYFTPEGARSGASRFPPEFPATIRDRDDRLPLDALVYGVRAGGAARAYALDALARRPVVEERVGGQAVTVWYDAASRSAAAYLPRVGERRLTFETAGPGRKRDRETESLWNMDGQSVGGPLRGERLEPAQGLMSEWYGWYASHPETTVWSP